MARTGLYWFRHDLRIQDNETLLRFCASCDAGLFVFILDPRWFKQSHFQSAHMGKHRATFLAESLRSLKQSLNEHGQDLIILQGNPLALIPQIVDELKIDLIASSFHPGTYERQQVRRLRESLRCDWLYENSHTLFQQAQLPFELSELPKHFTPFRKKVEKLIVDGLFATPDKFPEQIEQAWLEHGVLEQSNLKKDSFEHQPINQAFSLINSNESASAEGQHPHFSGGSKFGLKRLNTYLFESENILTYKQTRNGMLRFDDSSKLSPWLANGSISAKQVYFAIKRFEHERCANESTYWLFFEILWREYFQWYLILHDHQMFKFGGVQGKKPLTSFWPERFVKWCNGETAFAIVNACMHELNQTGFMSNRGRQLVASCLVHELQLDWRFGAAYFEQQLIDFDVASNWGNWQYLAGVGADPRGHRRFDLVKQQRMYDPDGDFVAHWHGESSSAPLDSSDMVDWPIKWH